MMMWESMCDVKWKMIRLYNNLNWTSACTYMHTHTHTYTYVYKKQISEGNTPDVNINYFIMSQLLNDFCFHFLILYLFFFFAIVFLFYKWGKFILKIILLSQNFY